MADRPNEQVDEGTELRPNADGAPLADGAADVDPKKSRPSVRWVQLAYDLEQYGDGNLDERGEVY